MNIHPRLLSKNTRIVAGHRGMKAVYPENTMLSFEKAIELGVDMLEIDLHITKDGQVVIIHDHTLDRTTDGTGPIREISSAEIARLDAGSHFGAQFAGLRVPLLADFCQYMASHREILLNVEIKDRTHECVEKALDLLARHHLIENCVFACFDARIVQYIHEKHDLPCQGFPGHYMENFEPGLRGTFSHMAAVGIQMDGLTPERVQDYEQMGILPWAYCPDTERDAAKARYCGVPLVTSNNPAACLKIFRGDS